MAMLGRLNQGDENLSKYCTLTEVLYVSSWYVSLGHIWGSNILKVFPYEGGLWSIGLLTIKSGEQGAPPLMV